MLYKVVYRGMTEGVWVMTSSVPGFIPNDHLVSEAPSLPQRTASKGVSAADLLQKLKARAAAQSGKDLTFSYRVF